VSRLEYFGLTAADLLSASDVATRSVGRLSQSNDLFNISDLASHGAIVHPAGNSLIRFASDAWVVGDSAIRISRHPRPLTEIVLVSDNALQFVGTGRLAVDSIVLAESIKPLLVSAVDLVGLLDLARAHIVFVRSASDVVVFSDEAVGVVHLKPKLYSVRVVSLGTDGLKVAESVESISASLISGGIKVVEGVDSISASLASDVLMIEEQ
jgi:hypothetical protein